MSNNSMEIDEQTGAIGGSNFDLEGLQRSGFGRPLT